MKRVVVQVVVLLALALIAGTAANLARQGDDTKFLPWSTSIYGPPTLTKKRSVDSEPAPPTALAPPKVKTTPDSTADPSAVTPTEAPVTSASEDEPADEFQRLSFEEAVVEWESLSTFVDARRTKEYVKGHITGSWSMSPYEQGSLAEKMIAIQEEVPEEAAVIVYCSASADCEDSAIIGRQLKQAGFVYVCIYKGGFPEWDVKVTDPDKRAKMITTGEERGEVEP